jgi:hypothetical protein
MECALCDARIRIEIRTVKRLSREWSGAAMQGEKARKSAVQADAVASGISEMLRSFGEILRNLGEISVSQSSL